MLICLFFHAFVFHMFVSRLFACAVLLYVVLCLVCSVFFFFVVFPVLANHLRLCNTKSNTKRTTQNEQHNTQTTHWGVRLGEGVILGEGCFELFALQFVCFCCYYCCLVCVVFVLLCVHVFLCCVPCPR